MAKRDINSIHHSIKQAEQHLSASDAVMAQLIAQHGPCTMFDDNALLHKTPFHVMVWAIINQQLSVASARSIEQRLLARHRGDTFVRRTIEQLPDAALAACGLSRQKIRYLRALCEAVSSRQLHLASLRHKSNAEVAELLIRLPGVGPWTIDMFLMFSLARLDVLPLGDLALRKSIELHYNIDSTRHINKLGAISNRWQPYRSIASWYLWCAVD